MTHASHLRAALELRPIAHGLDLDVRCLLVENVPEFVEWGPVHQHAASHPRCLAAGCRAERPCRRRAGCYYRAWTRRLEGEGYRVEHRVLNAADFGGATTRSRFFLLGRKDRRRIVWPAPTHAKRGGKPATGDLFTGPLKPWRGAREVIDWSLSGRSIFGRKKPLSPKTLARIQAGAVKFGWPEPFLALLRHHIENPRAPLPTFDADGKRTGWRWPEPVVTVLRRHADAQSLEAPLPTVTAGGTHLGIATPFVIGNRAHATAKDLDADPVPTATTSTGGGVALVEPLVVRTDMHRSNAACVRGAGDPLATVTTGGGFAVAEPFVSPFYGDKNGRPRASRGIDEPLATQSTENRFGLVEPIVLPQGGGGAARPVGEPVATIATDGAHALVAPYYGTICAEGRVDLVQGRAGPTYDILFRMLTPRELARAMGFSDAEQEYEFAGNKTEITRQIGNAVSVEQAEALVGAIVDAGVAARERVA